MHAELYELQIIYSKFPAAPLFLNFRDMYVYLNTFIYSFTFFATCKLSENNLNI